MDKQNRLTQIQAESREWRFRNFDDKDRAAMPQLAGMAEELGEIAHGVLKLQQGIRGDEATHRDEIADGIGDLIIFTMGLADNYGLDVMGCVEEAWDQVKLRNWRDRPETG